MHGPERWGCVLFGLNHQEEWRADPDDQEADSSEHYILRIRGELFLGITKPRHQLPRNMWDRQRRGGHLSDGATQVWWIIHDINIPGRIGERYFEVVFVGRQGTGRSFETWRRFVKREWWAYVHAGKRPFTSQPGRAWLQDMGGPPGLMAALRYVRHDYYWNEHDVDSFHREYQRNTPIESQQIGLRTSTGRQGRLTSTRRSRESRENVMPRTMLEELVLDPMLL